MTRWSRNQRQAFITERLAGPGYINRKDLMGKFEISTAQCAKDFAVYRAEHPGAMLYNASYRRYERAGLITNKVRVKLDYRKLKKALQFELRLAERQWQLLAERHGKRQSIFAKEAWRRMLRIQKVLYGKT